MKTMTFPVFRTAVPTALLLALPAAAEWTDDPSAQTLAQGTVVLENVTANGTKLFLSSLLGKLLLSLVCAAVLCHTVNSLNAEACCEDSHLHLVAEGWIEGETPFDFEVATELIHEVVDIVHLVHHQS